MISPEAIQIMAKTDALISEGRSLEDKRHIAEIIALRATDYADKCRKRLNDNLGTEAEGRE